MGVILLLPLFLFAAISTVMVLISAWRCVANYAYGGTDALAISLYLAIVGALFCVRLPWLGILMASTSSWIALPCFSVGETNSPWARLSRFRITELLALVAFTAAQLTLHRSLTEFFTNW